ncbi:hypothetical protein [Caminibacter pacificus]|uniref:Uncharacterized protein n=1 Tax=Caminibacter pacificus TaxID=1424653 RepID=A0AAJ4RDU6_9BACT|nr:hypothetical protein [Caminibacter pacificus]NPA87201.1 hypothetical protein [Campylobacterota bacterium]QCI28386.1 hypothetical protein C6V80_05275 [Caminibacter pacificus]ROR40890.1 hypothetical protein EDC58_0371 [Caminibacter pacificus]
MNKLIFFIFPLFLFAEIVKFPYTFSLKKDEIAKFKVYYEKHSYPLEMRWTLYKNEVLTVLYKYDDFPYQITLEREYPLNTFRVDIAKCPEKIPYFLIEFVDFNDKIAKFRIYLFNGKKVRVKKGE